MASRSRSLPPEQRDVAMAFESYALYPHLSVREHLEFPLRAPGRRLASRRHRRAGAAGGGSAGDRRRCWRAVRRSSAAASGSGCRWAAPWCVKARFTLLDEPVAHLDARLRHDLRGELKRHQQASGATSIYATPDFSEAAAVADRIAVLVDGELRQIRHPANIYDRPADVDVALLAGDLKMNLFDANRLASLTATSPPRLGQVGMRPSEIRVLGRAQPSALAGKVYVAEPMGYDQIVRVETGRPDRDRPHAAGPGALRDRSAGLARTRLAPAAPVRRPRTASGPGVELTAHPRPTPWQASSLKTSSSSTVG